MVAYLYYKQPPAKHKHSVIARALARAGYTVKPGVLSGRPLARLIVKAGAQW